MRFTLTPKLVVVAITLYAAQASADEAAITAFCERLFACEFEPNVAGCVANAQDSDDNARSVGDAICDTYADAEFAFFACVGALDTCASFGVLCADEDAVRDALEAQGASACGNGESPRPPPSSWTCDPGSFNARDGCDCGCGADDIDCSDGCAAPGCDAPSCVYCHNEDGAYVACDDDAGEGDAGEDEGGDGEDDVGVVPTPDPFACGAGDGWWSPSVLGGLALVLWLLRRRRL
jgi:hypothetical protein